MMMIPSLENLFLDTCKALDVQPKLVAGKSRNGDLCMARCIFCYVAFTYTKFSFKQIGEQIGGRHHTSVIHQRNCAMDYMDSNNSKFIEKYNQYKIASIYFNKLTVVRSVKK